MAWRAPVDAAQCAGICPVEIYAFRGGTAVPVNGGGCLGCELCLGACEPGAFTFFEM